MKTPKNLLFLFSDQHAQRVAGCYGDAVARTPALDALAARGTRYDNAYCPSPICTPSRASMLTACHPHQQECWTNDDILASDRPTWLHALGAAGHRPELIGRLHAIGPDQLHGYVSRQVGEHSPNWPGVPAHDMGVLQGANNPTPESLMAVGAGQSAYEVKDRDVAKAAIAKLEHHADAGTPFAMTVGLMLPHAPYVVDRVRLEYYLERLPEPVIPPAARPHPWIAWWRDHRGIEGIPKGNLRLARAAYWALTEVLDEIIGHILDRLEALGLAEDTLVVYASDHGDHAGERGLWWKHTFFDESAKVPMILSCPGVVPAGAVSGDVVSLTDLAQTMIDAMGGTVLPNAAGRSFWPRLTGQGQTWEDRAFSEYCYDAVPDWTGGRTVEARMLREERWKLIYYAGHRPMLFDMEDDPQEVNDLAQDPDHAETRDRLMRVLLDGWDPDAIRDRMAERRADKDILARWAARTRPQSTHIWPMTPEMNRLDVGE